jgi:hypothetical protein
MTPLLDKWYPTHKVHDRTRTLELIIGDLWRQYPAWPSTFSKCAGEYCENASRGGHLCPSCLTFALAELVGEARAAKYAATVDDCARARHALYSACSEA